jgi:hypothetical protein
MPDGSCVIKYEGKRGVVWYLKYRDADGRQVKERLGQAADGWDRRKATTELRARLTAVEKEGLRRLVPMTFAAFTLEWRETYPDLKDLKRSTRDGYRLIIDGHLSRCSALGSSTPLTLATSSGTSRESDAKASGRERSTDISIS